MWQSFIMLFNVSYIYLQHETYWYCSSWSCRFFKRICKTYLNQPLEKVPLRVLLKIVFIETDEKLDKKPILVKNCIVVKFILLFFLGSMAKWIVGIKNLWNMSIVTWRFPGNAQFFQNTILGVWFYFGNFLEN